MTTKLPTLKLIEQKDIAEFIRFWSNLYSYPGDKIYGNTIIKTRFDNDDIIKLYTWKNVTKLSGGKQKSLNNKIISKLTTINSLKLDKNFKLDDFLEEFKDVSFVWKIFLLHIIRPKEYPIYDQHIHRTYNYIHGLEYKNITNKISDKNKEQFYFETYLKFIKSINGHNLKVIDEAFFSFGQFINTKKNDPLFL